jgi:hypothetical protein
MKNFFIKYRIQIKLVLTLLFGVLAFIKWQEYRANNSKTDLIGFAIFGLAFIINIFDVKYYSKKKVGSNNNA